MARNGTPGGYAPTTPAPAKGAPLSHTHLHTRTYKPRTTGQSTTRTCAYNPNTCEKAPGCVRTGLRAITRTLTYPNPIKALSVDPAKSIYYVVRGRLDQWHFPPRSKNPSWKTSDPPFRLPSRFRKRTRKIPENSESGKSVFRVLVGTERPFILVLVGTEPPFIRVLSEDERAGMNGHSVGFATFHRLPPHCNWYTCQMWLARHT